MNITIRPYKNEDYEQVKKLLIDTKLYYEVVDTKEHLARKIKKDPKSILLSLDNNKIVGVIFFLEDNGWVAFIFHLAVDKNYQGKGIGKKLMNKAEEIIKKRNGYQTRIIVDMFNESVLGFYKKLGYYDEGKLFMYVKDLI